MSSLLRKLLAFAPVPFMPPTDRDMPPLEGKEARPVAAQWQPKKTASSCVGRSQCLCPCGQPGGVKPNRSIPSASVIPVLTYPDVREAVAWLCSTFGF